MGAVTAVGREPGEAVHGFAFHALGGAGRLRFAGIGREAAEAAAIAAVGWLQAVERKLSRFRPDSLVARLNRGEAVAADADLAALWRAAADMERRTQGRLAVTAHPLWQLWHDPLRREPPGPAELAAAAARCRPVRLLAEGPFVRLSRPGAALDFGGLGKEWCVDRIADLLGQRGLRNFLVELAGDVAARGRSSERQPGWWVLLPGDRWAWPLVDAALATSGHRMRCRELGGRRISHLIDARSGRPAPGAVVSATVLGATCLEAGIAASDAALAGDAEVALARLGDLPGMLQMARGECILHATLAQGVRVVGHAGHPLAAGRAQMAA